MLGMMKVLLPLITLPVVSTSLQSRNADAVALCAAVFSTWLDLDTDCDVQAIETCEAGLLQAFCSCVLSTSVLLALVERLTRILGCDEIAVVGSTCGGLTVCCTVNAVCCNAIGVCTIVVMRLSDDRIVATRHRCVVGGCSLWLHIGLAFARVLVKQLQKCLVGLVIKVVNLVSSSKEVGNGLWRRLVSNGRADNVRHVAPISLSRNVKLGFAVEASKSGKMHVTSQNGDTNAMLLGKVLKPMDQDLALLLVRPRGPMVIEIIHEINTAVELVEDTSTNTKALVEEFDRSYQGT